jgi:hypothetical protein
LDAPSSPQPAKVGDSLRSKPKVRAIEPFCQLEGLQWNEVTMEFVSNDSIKISAREVRNIFIFVELGFKDKRRGDRPIPLWDVFQKLAQHNGRIEWPKWRATSRDATSKTISRIRRLLQQFMGIDDDPFDPYHEHKTYVTKFRLKDRSFRSASTSMDVQ